MTSATSGTFGFSPSVGEIVLDAFARIGVPQTEVSQMHLNRAMREANYWLSSISNRGPNLWTVDLQSVTLVQGTPTYTVPPETVMILDLYIEQGDETGSPNSRLLSSIDRSDYAALSNKLQQGPPTSFWFDRLISPTISLWPCPDGGGPYTLKYFRYRQVQDAGVAGAQTPEVPYLFLDAFVAGLAHRLARCYKPELVAQLKADADEAWQIAATQNTENSPMGLAPGISIYWN